MPRRKELPEDIKNLPSGVKPLEETSNPLVERRLRQDLTLSKGEREKGASPAWALGKKEQRKRR